MSLPEADAVIDRYRFIYTGRPTYECDLKIPNNWTRFVLTLPKIGEKNFYREATSISCFSERMLNQFYAPDSVAWKTGLCYKVKHCTASFSGHHYRIGLDEERPLILHGSAAFYEYIGYDRVKKKYL